MPALSPFEIAFAQTDAVERGFVDNPKDNGGPTNHGITERIARAYGYTGSMQELPLRVAQEIGRKFYWDPMQGDAIAQISLSVACKVFDLNFQFYAGAAITFLQRSLNALTSSYAPAATSAAIAVDGHCGPITLQALRDFIRARGSAGEVVLEKSLEGLQVADYLRQVEASFSKSSSYYGWLAKRVR